VAKLFVAISIVFHIKYGKISCCVLSSKSPQYEESMPMDAKIKFLEMIQSVITRMASNSFMLKGWAVTLVAGTFVLSAREANNLFFLIAYVPILVFWFLDSYYLQLERKYRILYNKVTDQNLDEIDFKLSVGKSKAEDKTCFFQSLMSPTELWFYFPTAILVAIVIIISQLAIN